MNHKLGQTSGWLRTWTVHQVNTRKNTALFVQGRGSNVGFVHPEWSIPSRLGTEFHPTVLSHEALIYQCLDVEVVPDIITVIIVTGGLTLLPHHPRGQAELLQVGPWFCLVRGVEIIGDVEYLKYFALNNSWLYLETAPWFITHYKVIQTFILDLTAFHT